MWKKIRSPLTPTNTQASQSQKHYLPPIIANGPFTGTTLVKIMKNEIIDFTRGHLDDYTRQSQALWRQQGTLLLYQLPHERKYLVVLLGLCENLNSNKIVEELMTLKITTEVYPMISKRTNTTRPHRHPYSRTHPESPWWLDEIGPENLLRLKEQVSKDMRGCERQESYWRHAAHKRKKSHKLKSFSVYGIDIDTAIFWIQKNRYSYYIL